MVTHDLKLQLAAAIEEIAILNRHLAKIEPSLLAVQHALEEVSPDRFAQAYERNLSEPIPVRVAQELNSRSDQILAIARQLRA